MHLTAEIAATLGDLIDWKTAVGLVIGGLLTFLGRIGEETVILPRRRVVESIRAITTQLPTLRSSVLRAMGGGQSERPKNVELIRKLAAQLRTDAKALPGFWFFTLPASKRAVLHSCDQMDALADNLMLRQDWTVRQTQLDAVLATLEGRKPAAHPSNAKPGGAEAGD